MKNRIISILNKAILTVATAAGILTGTAFAQQTTGKTDDNRAQLVEELHRQTKEMYAKSLAVLDNAAGEKAGAAAVVLTNGDNFRVGKEFAVAMFDAEGIDESDEAFNYTIIDLAYLIDRLEGQAEAVKLQKTLKSVLRGTSSAAAVKTEIEIISRLYLNRQKATQKWYFNAGRAAMNLKISSYLGEDARVKKDLSDLQALIKIAPKGTSESILEPMGNLVKYAAKATFTDEDYTAIYDGIDGVMNAVSA